jgi:hypothetical protein
MDPRRTGLGCSAEQSQIAGGEYAARQGRGLCGWANEKVPGAAQVVLADAGLIYNIPAGRRVMVTQWCYAVETTSDDCQFEFGYVDAGGTFRALGPHKHVYTGAANTGRTAYDQDITPAEPVSYAAGARRITFRVDANDAACEITMGWHGWWEYE